MAGGVKVFDVVNDLFPVLYKMCLFLLQRKDKKRKDKDKKKKEKKKKEKEKKKEKHKKKEKKTEDKKPERRPFDRDLDLKVNQFDDAMRKQYIKKAQGLGSRFGHAGKQKYL